MQINSLSTTERNQMVDITTKVQDYASNEGIVEGLVFVYVPHTTAGVTINEGADPAVTLDIETHLKKLIPKDAGFRHGEGNSDGHIKSSLMGCSAMVPVSGGKIALGTWQAVYFCEFDGPRSRSYYLAAVK